MLFFGYEYIFIDRFNLLLDLNGEVNKNLHTPP